MSDQSKPVAAESGDARENTLQDRWIEKFMLDALAAIAGAVCTPEKGYLEDGGLNQLLADIKTLRKQHDDSRATIASLEQRVAYFEHSAGPAIDEAYIADLEQRATAAEADLAKYRKVIVGDNITRLPRGCYAYQKQDWAAWGVKLVDRDDEIADRGWNFIRLPDAAPPGPQRGPASVAQIQAQSKQAEREV